jgi:hypothetical protein
MVILDEVKLLEAKSAAEAQNLVSEFLTPGTVLPSPEESGEETITLPPVSHLERPDNPDPAKGALVWQDKDGIWILPIPAGTSLSFNLKVNFYSAQQDPAVATPTAFSTQAQRWPYIVRQDLFPGRSLYGAAFYCADGTGWVQNPNGWNNEPTMHIYDTDGVMLLASKGDYTGLNRLKNFVVGRCQSANLTAMNADAVGVIHWDALFGGRYPQSGTSYVGDVRAGRILCPELWYRDANFPTSIVQLFVQGMTIDVHGNKWPNMIVGHGIRGSIFVPASPGINAHQRTSIHWKRVR